MDVVSKKTAEKLMGYMSKFKMVDIIGFAKIVGIESEDIKKAMFENNMDDIVAQSVMLYFDCPRVQRRRLMKLAKDIAAENCVEEQDNTSP